MWIDLDRLTDEERQSFTKDLIDRESNCLDKGFYSKFYEYTLGNALFVDELLKQFKESNILQIDSNGNLYEAIPIDWESIRARGKIEAVIEERVNNLPKYLHELLIIASIQGRDFFAPIVAKIQKVEERGVLRDLREAVNNHLLIHEVKNQDTGHFAFNHILFQQFLYGSISLAERSCLHLETANYLEENPRYKSERLTVLLAWHYASAHEPEKAVSYLVKSADRAFDLMALEDAFNYLIQGQNLLDNHRDKFIRPDIYQLQIRFSFSKVYLEQGDIGKAREAGKEALDLARKLNDTQTLAQILVLIGGMEYRKQLHKLAEDYFQEALNVAQQGNYRECEIEALLGLARTYRRVKPQSDNESIVLFNRAVPCQGI